MRQAAPAVAPSGCLAMKDREREVKFLVFPLELFAFSSCAGGGQLQHVSAVAC